MIDAISIKSAAFPRGNKIILFKTMGHWYMLYFTPCWQNTPIKCSYVTAPASSLHLLLLLTIAYCLFLVPLCPTYWVLQLTLIVVAPLYCPLPNGHSCWLQIRHMAIPTCLFVTAHLTLLCFCWWFSFVHSLFWVNLLPLWIYD